MSSQLARIAQEVRGMLSLRESAAVPHWAASRLTELCGATGSRVLRVYPASAARTRGAASGYAVSVSTDPSGMIGKPSPLPAGERLILSAIEARKPCEDAAQGKLAIPLCAADEVHYVIELSISGGSAERAVADELAPILGAYYDLLADAEADALTRLGNRRLFYSQMGSGLAAWAALDARPRYLAMADIDHFKQVNDQYGHLYGDEILIHYARILRETFRAGDLLYRFGGEEFVIVFAVGRDADGPVALERFRSAVESYAFPRVGRITTSVGYAALEGARVPATTLIDRADQAVYYAKRNGRNRVCRYEELVASGALQAPPASGGDATLF